MSSPEESEDEDEVIAKLLHSDSEDEGAATVAPVPRPRRPPAAPKEAHHDVKGTATGGSPIHPPSPPKEKPSDDADEDSDSESLHSSDFDTDDDLPGLGGGYTPSSQTSLHRGEQRVLPRRSPPSSEKHTTAVVDSSKPEEKRPMEERRSSEKRKSLEAVLPTPAAVPIGADFGLSAHTHDWLIQHDVSPPCR